MTLPTIRPPSVLPLFRNQGHSVEEQDVFASLATGRGHARKRRVSTTAQRTVTVSWFLTQAQMTALDAWFETTLVVGTLQFAALVKKQGEGTEWWTAAWVEPYTATPRNNGWWEVSGRLLLSGEPSSAGPATQPLELELSAALIVTLIVAEAHALAIELSASLVVSTAVADRSATLSPGAAVLAIVGYAPDVFVTQLTTTTTSSGASADAALHRICGGI